MDRAIGRSNGRAAPAPAGGSSATAGAFEGDGLRAHSDRSHRVPDNREESPDRSPGARAIHRGAAPSTSGSGLAVSVRGGTLSQRASVLADLEAAGPRGVCARDFYRTARPNARNWISD